jgi:hypothetical protein
MADESDVERIARQVLLEVAPEEEPLFPVAAARFRRDPNRPPETAGDQELGFAPEVVATAIASLALWLTQQALTYLAGLANPDGSSERPVRVRLRRLLARIPLLGRFYRDTQVAGRPTEPIPPAHLAQVRQVCRDKAVDAGLEPARAELLADAIVGRLAVAS